METKDELHERLILIVEHYRKTVISTNVDFKHHSIVRLDAWLEILKQGKINEDMVEWVRNLAKFHRSTDPKFADYLEELCLEI